MALTSARAPERSVHLLLAVLGVAVTAWVGVILLHSGLMVGAANERLTALPAGVRQFLRYCGGSPGMAGPAFGSWMAGWALMAVAMMLPPLLPLLRAAERLLQDRGDRTALILTLVMAFVGVWIVAGGAMFAAGSALRAGLDALSGGVPLRTDIAAGVAAIAAGAFQFTPLKMACMDACRSPAAVMMVDWRDGDPLRSAMRVGVRYGMICVGCCWAMMTLGVLVGTLMLPIMVLCALMMTLERLAPTVRPLVPLQAGFAILVGALLLAGTIPPAFF